MTSFKKPANHCSQKKNSTTNICGILTELMYYYNSFRQRNKSRCLVLYFSSISSTYPCMSHRRWTFRRTVVSLASSFAEFLDDHECYNHPTFLRLAGWSVESFERKQITVQISLVRIIAIKDSLCWDIPMRATQ